MGARHVHQDEGARRGEACVCGASGDVPGTMPSATMPAAAAGRLGIVRMIVRDRARRIGSWCGRASAKLGGCSLPDSPHGSGGTSCRHRAAVALFHNRRAPGDLTARPSGGPDSRHKPPIDAGDIDHNARPVRLEIEHSDREQPEHYPLAQGSLTGPAPGQGRGIDDCRSIDHDRCAMWIGHSSLLPGDKFLPH
jgi:hypothetical protein